MQQQFLPSEIPLSVASPATSVETLYETEESQDQEEVTEAGVETRTLAKSRALDIFLDKAKRKTRNRKITFWGAFAIIESVNLLRVPLRELAGMNHTVLIWLAGLSVSLLITAIIVMLRVSFMPINFEINELVRAGDVRAIPVLVNSLNSGMARGPRKTIYRALAALLPQLKASDTKLLTRTHRRLLNNSLRFGAGSIFGKGVPLEFMLAVLKAYEQVGDATAIPFVKALADKKARGARQQRIQEAAQACLPLLQASTNTIGQAQTLLRAAGKTDTVPDMLLRPATETTATSDPDLLLRAIHSADTSTP